MSLTSTFALVSLGTMAVLAAALTWLFQATLVDAAQDDAERLADNYVTMGVERVITPELSEFWSDPGSVSFADRQLLMIGANNRVESLDGLNLYSESGELLWSRTGEVGSLQGDERRLLDEAVDTGQPASTLESVDGEPSLAVYVPVTYGDAYSGIYGVAEVLLPYGPTQQRLQDAVLTMAGLIFAVVLVGWLLLFRVVHRASNRLRQQSADNEYLALHDPLTGLPNRRLLTDRLSQAILSSQRSGEPLTLMILDVDRFKEINDTLGHDRGDKLLVEVASRLAGAIRDADTVARLGGDEFAVLAPSVSSLMDADRLARRVHAVFNRPFLIDDLALHVDCSVGLAILPDQAADATELFQRADIAMYAAKSGHLGVISYDPETDDSSTDWLLLGDLRAAIGTSQLTVHYQPKISLQTGEPVGLEALLRWQHPVRGNVPPNAFVPIAERSGLIRNLTRYVLELVIQQMAEWDRVEAEFAQLPVAVNLSARNLVENDFHEFVEDLLLAHLIEPERLELELTESALIEDPERSHAMLHKLSALGVTLAVDDFGTGYTSMAALEAMPLDALKIDRSFVQRMTEEGGVTLVRAIVDLAHEFGLKVVAEGVEDEAVTEQLRELGCDVGQGYHWSRPVPGDDLRAVLLHQFARRNKEGASVG